MAVDALPDPLYLLELRSTRVAAAELALLAVAGGTLGAYIVLRRLAFFTHATGTATFPGAVLAEAAGFSPRVAALAVALGFVKLPQEYWIHIAQRDFTDTVAETPAVGWGATVAVLALVAILSLGVRPRLPAADHGWRLRADPLPVPADAHRAHARRLRTIRPLLVEMAEKIALLGLLCVIFTEILPGLEATPVQVLVGVALIVGANAALSLAYARSASAGRRRAGAHFVALVAANFALVFLASALLSDRDDFQLGAGVFFAFLITLIVWLFDAYKPLHDVRF